MKIKDLADGVTYNFRIRAKTLTYGPEVEANITTGPGEGETLSSWLYLLIYSSYFTPRRQFSLNIQHSSIFLRSSWPSWRAFHFSVRHRSHVALDKWWSRPCPDHTICHWGQALGWDTYFCFIHAVTRALSMISCGWTVTLCVTSQVHSVFGKKHFWCVCSLILLWETGSPKTGRLYTLGLFSN